VGLLHDVGKISADFQRYLRRCHQSVLSGRASPRSGIDHAKPGALLARAIHQVCVLPILGHHGELPSISDYRARVGAAQDSLQDATQLAQAIASSLVPPSAAEAAVSEVAALACSEVEVEVLIRFLYSCLVDADALDTENHFRPGVAAQRKAAADLADLEDRFARNQAHLLHSAPPSAVNEVRRAVYDDCLRAAVLAPGVFKLTVPTGGGKTRSSLGFALRHGLHHGLERIIYAIPYTSITEQTANVFREIMADPQLVLEHHSAAPFETAKDDEADSEGAGLWARLAAENWDAPLIVTTTVQLFESLFSNRPGRCRKVHRIARSVLILDEVQTLPIGLLAPILSMLKTLVERYGVTVVLCTATQPALAEQSRYLEGFVSITEIVAEPARHFERLQRVQYTIPPQPWSWGDAARAMRERPQCLTVLNARKDALALLDTLNDPDALHLSTLLCAAHRRGALAEIAARLRQGRPCRVVSTQVVEAGVDLDFPCVLRAFGPLDRVAQAAGRCNREGGRDAAGEVVVFEPEEGSVPTGAYRTAYHAAIPYLRGSDLDLDDPGVFEKYFRDLFALIEPDQWRIQQSRRHLDYPTVARDFRMIRDDTMPVLTPYNPEALDNVLRQVRAEGRLTRDLWRQAQPLCVNIYRRDFERFQRQGLLAEALPGSGLFRWTGGYDQVRGIAELRADPADLIV
jgi:CRISPR-associated endonuclease/helicase Cas3